MKWVFLMAEREAGFYSLKKSPNSQTTPYRYPLSCSLWLVSAVRLVWKRRGGEGRGLGRQVAAQCVCVTARWNPARRVEAGHVRVPGEEEETHTCSWPGPGPGCLLAEASENSHWVGLGACCCFCTQVLPASVATKEVLKAILRIIKSVIAWKELLCVYSVLLITNSFLNAETRAFCGYFVHLAIFIIIRAPWLRCLGFNSNMLGCQSLVQKSGLMLAWRKEPSWLCLRT